MNNSASATNAVKVQDRRRAYANAATPKIRAGAGSTRSTAVTPPTMP